MTKIIEILFMKTYSMSVRRKQVTHNSVDPRHSTKKSIIQLPFEMMGLEDDTRTLRQILTASLDPILITTADAKIVYVNPAWEKLTGYAFSEVYGKNPSILQSGKTPQRVYKRMWQTLAKGKDFSSDEVIDKKKNGAEYHISSNIYPLIRNHKVCYFVQLQHDITAAKKLDELRKEFLYASAHELKTPITVLKLFTRSHLNRAKKLGTDTVKASELELINEELDRLMRLINDMLDSSRFETGKQFMTFEILDIEDLIKKTIEKIRIYAKNHTIVFKKPNEKTTVIADSERIEQVLLNLLSNAVKYSEDDRTITVSVEKKNNKAIVSVKDEGIGIPKGTSKVIFDRYYQVKAKDKRGFGLGLYISKEIIKRHHGKIWVESEQGKGSTFYFSLPLAE